ncbi:hypothetical protein [Deinococcus sonorensis]|uniref:Uncharacterized protein n=1 Tax=Deinococcus sonorensis TaxID=309891 RepID=A0ABV8YCD3_9DEIO
MHAAFNDPGKPHEWILGTYDSDEEARQAFETRFQRQGWSCLTLPGALPQYSLGTRVERRGVWYALTQKVTLSGRPGKEWMATFGEVRERLDHASGPPLRGIRPEVEELVVAGALGTRSSRLLEVAGGIETPLSDEEAALAAELIQWVDEDAADVLVALVRSAVAWPAVVLADVEGGTGTVMDTLRSAARRALGFDGSWPREQHLPPDFPAALLPEARPKLTSDEAVTLGWQFAGTHRAVLHDHGPDGVYEMWERVSNPNESVVVLLQMELDPPRWWRRERPDGSNFPTAPFDAVQGVQRGVFVNGELNEDASGLSHLADLYGWKCVFDAVMAVLRNPEFIPVWLKTTAVLWGLRSHWHERRVGSDEVWSRHLLDAVERSRGVLLDVDQHMFEELVARVLNALRGHPANGYDIEF